VFERLTGIRLAALGRLGRTAMLVSLLALLAALAVSVSDVIKYPGEDLRPKVTGARAMLLGLDPYTYEAGPDTPEELQDYTRVFAHLTRVTYPPTLLALYAPLSPLPFRAQRYFWAAAEWVALLATLLLLTRSLGSQRARVLFFTLACIFFAGGDFWRLHVERGQYYAFVLLLLAGGSFLLLRGRHGPWVQGLPIGFAIALRPTLAVMIPALWLLRLRKPAVSAAGTAALLVALTLPLAGIRGWLQYQRSVAMLERTILGDKETIRSLGQPYRPPPVIEGHDYSQTAYLRSYTANTSFSWIVPRLLQLRDREAWMAISKVLAFACAAAFLIAALVLGAARRSLRTRAALAIVAALMVDDFLILRVSYADVLLLAPLALLLPALIRQRTPPLFAALLLGGLVLGANLLLVWTPIGWLGPIVRSAAVMLGLVCSCLWLSSFAQPGHRQPLRLREESEEQK